VPRGNLALYGELERKIVRKRRERVDPTKMTHTGHKPDRNLAAQQSALCAFRCGADCGRDRSEADMRRTGQIG
jgi:hypothetical protein